MSATQLFSTPPHTARLPHKTPESLLSGATPTKAASCLGGRLPSSGSSAKRSVLATTGPTPGTPRRTQSSTAFLEKGEPLRERSPQHSVSTKGLGPCASQPGGPFSSRTAVDAPWRGPLPRRPPFAHGPYVVPPWSRGPSLRMRVLSPRFSGGGPGNCSGSLCQKTDARTIQLLAVLLWTRAGAGLSRPSGRFYDR